MFALLFLILATVAPSGGPERAALQAVQNREIISAIQVHGNTITPDDEIKRLAAIEIGAAVEPGTVEAVAGRLRAARRFESVQVLKRFASIADPSQILLVIVVDEGPVTVEATDDPNRPVRVVKTGRKMMFLPVLSAEDGYGVTYGARFAWPDLLGKNTRLGVPATWGGDRRAGADLEKTFTAGIVDRVVFGASVSSRTNPFFDRDDQRVRVALRAERRLAQALRVGATGAWQRVAFMDAVDHVGTVGADVTFDTRVDPVLPRNAVYARAAWEHIAAANRTDLDVRGYLGATGQRVLAVRAQRSGSDRALPPYVKPLLGGMSNLRGFEAGTAAADTLVATSVELFQPLTSPLSFGRIGVSAFVDAATAYDDGQQLGDQSWKQGIGGSVWFSAASVRLNVAIAHGRGSSTRVHVGATVGF